MRRRLVKLVVFLLLGAAVNVAVAWGIAIWSSDIIPVESRAPTTSEHSLWIARAPTGWDFEPSAIVVSRGFGLVTSTIGNPPKPFFVGPPNDKEMAGFGYMGDAPAAKGAGDDLAMAINAGWPLICMHGVRWVGSPHPQTPHNTGDHCQYTVQLSQSLGGRLIPLRPTWPGFPANMVVYAASCWLLLAPISALRRRHRIKRGLCPSCKYPVGTSPVCTECGNAVHRRPSHAASQ